MAYRARGVKVDFIIPVLDARRMEVYSKVFDADLNEVRETKAEIINENSFVSYLKKGKVLLMGSGAEKCKEVLSYAGLEFNFSVVPSAKEMSQLSHLKYKNGDFEDVAYFEPYYLKDFILQQKKRTTAKSKS
jgi:tRNA threonylcarbamoyladenosine biosynthesis protein TsaB